MNFRSSKITKDVLSEGRGSPELYKLVSTKNDESKHTNQRQSLTTPDALHDSDRPKFNRICSLRSVQTDKNECDRT